jgi:hypothetical protein
MSLKILLCHGAGNDPGPVTYGSVRSVLRRFPNVK